MSRAAQMADTEYELEAFNDGYSFVVGIDEAGRGAIAGDLYIGFSAISTDNLPHLLNKFNGVRDSKKFSSHSKRCATFYSVKHHADGVGYVAVPSTIIDQYGINSATAFGANIALKNILQHIQSTYNEMFEGVTDECELVKVVVDAGIFSHTETIPYCKFDMFPKADSLSLTVALASMSAKTERDNYMMNVAHSQYSSFGFDVNVGYWHSKVHVDGVTKYWQQRGRLPVIYRRSFKPISNLTGWKRPHTYGQSVPYHLEKMVSARII